MTILDGFDVELDGLSGLIAPIGMIGRHANLKGPHPFLGRETKRGKKKQNDSKHG